jgi:hypothetical protein
MTAPPRRQALFIGDSTVRQLYFAFVCLVDGGKGAVPKGWEADAEKHSDRKVTFYTGTGSTGEKSLELEFWWWVALVRNELTSGIRT